jgi:cysteine synthase A
MSWLNDIGSTPLVAVEGIWVKLECSNPGGSVKDRVAKFLLEQARERGELRPGDTIVEATSGNTGIAMALVARELGHAVIIFMPEHMSAERIQMLRVIGADVRLTSREGSFAGAVAERDRYRGKRGYYVPDQFGNPDNTRCHRLTTGAELLAQLAEHAVDRVDAFVAGTGTGGTLMGVGQALRETMPDVAVVAVEPEESAVMSGEPAGEHGIQGIGDGFIPDLVDMSFVDEVLRVSTAEALTTCNAIRENHGFCVGVSAGANFAASRLLRDRGLSVATVWPDCSDRYGSMGLQPPSAESVHCPLRARCAERGRQLLGQLKAGRN